MRPHMLTIMHRLRSDQYPCTHPSFMTSVYQAYELLCTREPGRQGVRAGVFMQLLARLTEALPPQAGEVLRRRFGVVNGGSVGLSGTPASGAGASGVGWRPFRLCIHTCILYVQFLAACETLFSQVMSPTGRTLYTYMYVCMYVCVCVFMYYIVLYACK